MVGSGASAAPRSKSRFSVTKSFRSIAGGDFSSDFMCIRAEHLQSMRQAGSERQQKRWSGTLLILGLGSSLLLSTRDHGSSGLGQFFLGLAEVFLRDHCTGVRTQDSVGDGVRSFIAVTEPMRRCRVPMVPVAIF